MIVTKLSPRTTMNKEIDKNNFRPLTDCPDVTGDLPTTAPQQGDYPAILLGKLVALFKNALALTGALFMKDAGAAWATVRGLTNSAPFTSADQSAAVAAVTAAPTSGQKLVITDLIVSVDTDMTATFTVETTGHVVHKLYLPAKSVVNLCTRSPVKLGTADKKLMVQTSAAGNIAVQALYYSEA